jgi:hypothetical protein
MKWDVLLKQKRKMMICKMQRASKDCSLSLVHLIVEPLLNGTTITTNPIRDAAINDANDVSKVP